MSTVRWDASALEVNDDQTLIIGGRDENWKDLKTTELISSSGSVKGKDFPPINQSMTMSALGDKWEVIGELDEALQTSFARSAKREQLELHPTPQ